MSTHKELIVADIDTYLAEHQAKGLLRFLTCGSVDDGKSTLIGRLLYDSKLVFEDHLAALERDSKKFGTQAGDLDLALLVDGLAAEREQGITIDVAYRFFSTRRRKFIVADTPGHEQYTRNMVTGASTADAAVLLVDARQGVLTQTRRHSYIVSLLGIRHIVLAVNKMDLVDYSQERFEGIVAEYRQLTARSDRQQATANPEATASLEVAANSEVAASLEVTAIPVSALMGDNVIGRSNNMPWYEGPTLLGYLESVEIDRTRMQRAPLRFPIQWVNRSNSAFRGFCGTICGGTVRPGDAIRVQPSGKQSRVARIVTDEGDLEQAVAGQSVTLTLCDEIDVSRGAMMSSASAPAEVADQFKVELVWMAEEPLLPGRPYLVKLGPSLVGGTITDIKHRVNVNTLERTAAKQLVLNDIAVCNLSLDRLVPFDAYRDNRETGSFVLIDRFTNNTVGAGMIHFALRRSHNIHLQAVDIDKSARAAVKVQKPCVVWFTGLSGSGKSTVANLVEKKLHALGHHTYLLDGDNVRHGLNRDLGFTKADRVENIRRIAEVAKLMVDAGLIVLTAFISPFRAERRLARELMQQGEFVEVFVDAPLEVAEQRDPKGLYEKARRGELKNFTGIDSPYEPPQAPELRLPTARITPEEAADRVIETLRAHGIRGAI